MKLTDTFANRLKQYRVENDLTLEELSRKTDVPAQTLSRYELGQRIPKIDVAANIAIALDVDPLWLQGYDIKNNSSPTEVKEELRDDLVKMGIISKDRDLTDSEISQLSRIISAILNHDK